jgi:RNA polymerase sigma factor (sigma-70 family)
MSANASMHSTSGENTISEAIASHGGMVRATCRRILGARHPSIDDAVQATFVILMRRGERARADSLAAWLHATCRGICLHVLRDDRRRRRREAVAEEHWKQQPPALDDELSGALDRAIVQLTAAQREVVLRHIVEGKPQAVVAAELNISEGAVKKRVADAMASMRNFFRRRGVAVTTASLAGTLAVDASAATNITLSATSPSIHLAHGVLKHMLISKLALSAAIAASIATATVFALPSRGAEPEIIKTETAEADSWTKIDADGKFSFDLPSFVKKKDVRGIDSFVGRYTSERFDVHFDYGMYSGDPGQFSKNKPGYSESSETIGHRVAKICFQPPREGRAKPYQATVHFSGQLNLTVDYRDEKDRDDVLRILRSVAFPDG